MCLSLINMWRFILWLVLGKLFLFEFVPTPDTVFSVFKDCEKPEELSLNLINNPLTEDQKQRIKLVYPKVRF